MIPAFASAAGDCLGVRSRQTIVDPRKPDISATDDFVGFLFPHQTICKPAGGLGERASFLGRAMCANRAPLRVLLMKLFRGAGPVCF